ncbi:MAG: nucleotidyltransferase domain-containing protein [Hamadaea sp.]|nr:nucleotidyltransferase domain-containing protein [Hamadaea sp.]NUT21446.1 nucleotidyltransferase domain-containing protein [Hamadaea sp.]
MDARLTAVPVLTTFGDRVRDLAGVAGLYAGGSLAYGDYRPGISDLDVIAVIDRDLDRKQRRQVTELHQSTPDKKLHCAYFVAGQGGRSCARALLLGARRAVPPDDQRHRPRRSAPWWDHRLRPAPGRPDPTRRRRHPPGRVPGRTHGVLVEGGR